MIRLKNSGDTIVEVLIAIAIVGMVLGAAYASATRSLQTNRRAQERAEAMRVAEEQLERMKVSAKSGDTIFTGGTEFCLVSDLSRRDFNGVPASDYNAETYTVMPSGIYPSECLYSYYGSYSYYAWVHRGAGDLYTVRVRWTAPGPFKQQVEINYRLHQP